MSAGAHAGDAGPASSAPLAALVYKSRATAQFNPESLDELVSDAQTRNAAEGLTGAVFYDDGRFLQWLEGPADRLDNVASSISCDGRHTDIELLSYGLVSARTYSGWTMQLLTRKPNVQISQTPNRFDGDMAPTIAARELADGNDSAAYAFLALAPATAAGAVAQCEKIAAAYRPLWQADLCDDVDITIGLSQLLRLFRRRTKSVAPAYRSLGSRFLVASAPGEPHFVGAAFVAGFLLEKGCLVDYHLSTTEQDLIQRIAASPANGVVIATSPVFSRAERAPDFLRLATAMSNATCRPGFTLYGRVPATLRGAAIGRVISRASDIDRDWPALAVAATPPQAGRHLHH